MEDPGEYADSISKNPLFNNNETKNIIELSNNSFNNMSGGQRKSIVDDYDSIIKNDYT